VDAHHHFALDQPERRGDLGIVDLGDFLHFQVVVAGTQGSHFVALALLGVIGHRLGLRALHLAVFFDALQVLRRAVTLLHRPACTAGQHGVHFVCVET
jgi:hypothetical protein